MPAAVRSIVITPPVVRPLAMDICQHQTPIVDELAARNDILAHS